MRLHLVVATITLVCGFSPSANAVIVNVDLNGASQGDAAPGLTYSGASAAGSGIIWNGVTVDSRTGVTLGTPTGTGNDYSIAVNATNLQDENGGATGVGVQFTNAGGDHLLVGGNSLWQDYLGVNFDGDNANVPFTINGLGSAATADLYFYHRFDNGNAAPLSVNIGGSSVAIAPIGIFTSSNTLYYQNVPVVGGSINGAVTFAAGYSILNGMSIEFVPEPSSLTLLGIAALGLIAACRSRRGEEASLS